MTALAPFAPLFLSKPLAPNGPSTHGFRLSGLVAGGMVPAQGLDSDLRWNDEKNRGIICASVRR